MIPSSLSSHSPPQKTFLADILLFSSTDWAGNWGSRQQIARLWARSGHRVLFVERMAGWEHFSRYPDLRHRRWARWRQGLAQIELNLWLVSPPPLWPGRYYLTSVARFNAAWMTRWLTPYLRRLGFDAPLLWFYKPEQAPLVGKFNAMGSVYHCIDEWTVGTGGRKKRVIQLLEAELLRRADLLLVNSRFTFERKRPFNPYTYRLPSGANVRHFQIAADLSVPASSELAHLSHPVLAYIGNVDERIDMDLLEQVAQARPSWTLLLIGRVNQLAVNIEPLQNLPNVVFLGERPFEQIPILLKTADICLLPYVSTEAAQYRSPLKLYEYLAVGLPIVTVPHPEVEEFHRLVTISLPSTWVEAIANALATDTPDRRQMRREIAAEHSWEARFTQLLAHLRAHPRLGQLRYANVKE